MATGGIVGDGSLDELVQHGRAVGKSAAARAAGKEGPPVPTLVPRPHPALFRARTHGFVDFSEDVSSKDLVSAVKEGYDSVELAKRFTTATMGAGPGQAGDGQRGRRGRRGHRAHDRRDRDHSVAPAPRPYKSGRPGGVRTRTGPLLPDAALARGPRSGPASGGAMDTALSTTGTRPQRCATYAKGSGSST